MCSEPRSRGRLSITGFEPPLHACIFSRVPIELLAKVLPIHPRHVRPPGTHHRIAITETVGEKHACMGAKGCR